MGDPQKRVVIAGYYKCPEKWTIYCKTKLHTLKKDKNLFFSLVQLLDDESHVTLINHKMDATCMYVHLQYVFVYRNLSTRNLFFCIIHINPIMSDVWEGGGACQKYPPPPRLHACKERGKIFNT